MPDPAVCAVSDVTEDAVGGVFVLYRSAAGATPSRPDSTRLALVGPGGDTYPWFNSVATAALANLPYPPNVDTTCVDVWTDSDYPAPGQRALVVTGSTVVRLLEDGSLDSTYGNGGTTVANESVNGIRSSYRLPDGSLLLGSTFYDGSPGYRFSLSRLTPDGDLDPTFGTNGRARIGFGDLQPSVSTPYANDDHLVGLGKLGDGGIVAYGTTTTGVAVARLTTAGVPDPALRPAPGSSSTNTAFRRSAP